MRASQKCSGQQHQLSNESKDEQQCIYVDIEGVLRRNKRTTFRPSNPIDTDISIKFHCIVGWYYQTGCNTRVWGLHHQFLYLNKSAMKIVVIKNTRDNCPASSTRIIFLFSFLSSLFCCLREEVEKRVQSAEQEIMSRGYKTLVHSCLVGKKGLKRHQFDFL